MTYVWLYKVGFNSGLLEGKIDLNLQYYMQLNLKEYTHTILIKYNIRVHN